MKKLVFDSFAMLAYFRGEKGKDEITQYLADIANGDKEGYISVVNVGEVFYISHRKDGKEKADDVSLLLISFPIILVDAGLHQSLEAAKLKAKYKISYADAFAAALAIEKKATLITGDPEFRQLEGEKGFKVKFI